MILSTRAEPLSPEDRRAQILAAAIPLLVEQGVRVTTKEIAQNADVAEGTLFRAFGSKRELIDAAIARILDPAPLIIEIEAIDSSLGVEPTIRELVRLLRARFEHVFSVMALLHEQGRHPHNAEVRSQVRDAIIAKLEPFSHQLVLDPRTAAALLRMLIFASQLPVFSAGEHVDDGSLIAFIVRGFTAQSAPDSILEPTPGA